MGDFQVDDMVMGDDNAIGLVMRKTPNFVEVRYDLIRLDRADDEQRALLNANNAHNDDRDNIVVGDFVEAMLPGRLVRIEGAHAFVTYDDGRGLHKFEMENNMANLNQMAAEINAEEAAAVPQQLAPGAPLRANAPAWQPPAAPQGGRRKTKRGRKSRKSRKSRKLRKSKKARRGKN